MTTDKKETTMFLRDADTINAAFAASPNPYWPRMVRRSYRRLRKAGVYRFMARMVISDLLSAGVQCEWHRLFTAQVDAGLTPDQWFVKP